ncbi:hypothetical protein TNCT_552861 [Trichonephila clavata]|uniref:Uncharacterized protein n=1 Tax=Trichonephila clavata TaxID=2740835 RepID=A0A8X6LBB7_TRICU|nr:hypothetical protein TNCT_552861 [Trichonephila clavata]
MAFLFHLEIIYYVALCAMATLLKGCLPSFIDILGYVSFAEMIKMGFLLSFEGLSMQTGLSSPERKKQYSSVPVVHSVMIFKVCQALNIEVELAPEKIRMTWIAKHNKRPGKKPKTPEVKSKMIYEICNALNIEVILSAKTEEDIGAIKPKPESKKISPPIVRSVVVHKICQALGLNSELSPAVEF